MLEAGQKFPTAELFRLTDGAPEAFSSDHFLKDRRVAIFGVPGAFTRTCSAKHLPGFISNAAALRAAGINEICCLSTNDVFVLAAWADQFGADGKVTMISDGAMNFTTAAGLQTDMSANGFGVRCRRFSMIVDDGTVLHMHLEAPGEFGKTSAETLLADLQT